MRGWRANWENKWTSFSCCPSNRVVISPNFVLPIISKEYSPLLSNDGHLNLPRNFPYFEGIQQEQGPLSACDAQPSSSRDGFLTKVVLQSSNAPRVKQWCKMCHNWEADRVYFYLDWYRCCCDVCISACDTTVIDNNAAQYLKSF